MTPIQKKYQSIGAEGSFLGTALTSEIIILDGLGIYQEFQHGIIYYSSDYGANIIGEKVLNKWKSDSVAKTVISDGVTTVRDYLGFPLKDTALNSRGGEVCYFERGMIVTVGIDAFVVYGSIYITYRKNGDINGWMGYPKSDEIVRGDGGRLSFFENADIYRKSSTESFEIRGAIREKYNLLGASVSFLGYPISNENILLKDKSEIGRSTNFEFGTIFWSPATGAHEMHGLLVLSYTKNYGGPAGELGFPTSDELSSPNGIYRFNNFQNGVLACNMTNGSIKKVSNLRLVITKLETDEDDDDLFVRSTSTLTVGGNEISRIGKDFGEYSNTGTKTLTESEGFIGDFPIRDGNAMLNVHMKSWDVDDGLNFGDDVIGEFTKSFGIESFWDSTLTDTTGHNLLTWYTGPDGRFRADFRIEVDGVVANPFDSENFRRDLFWHIHNPTIPKLEFDVYADTFSDVELDDSPVWHPFNHIYYQAAYKSAAAPGTCFGMCLEAIYALKGRSASRQFISQYQFDAQRKHDISVKFGYQLGASQINFLISKLKSGGLWNPVDNFNLSRELFNSGDYPIICLSKGLSLTDAHAVLPYRWDDSNPNEWLMFIANPNSPFNESPDNNTSDSVIRINPTTNTFTYQHDSKNTWVGGEGAFNGGRMFPFPYSELSSEPRTPFWEVILTIITGGAYLVFAGDAEVEQISSGIKSFYNEKGELNTDAGTRMNNIIPIETVGDPGRELFTSKIQSVNQRFNNVFRLKDQNKAKTFYIKNTRKTGKMYLDNLLKESTVFHGRIGSKFVGHIKTAIHSDTFSTSINRTNFNDQIDPNANQIEVLNIGEDAMKSLLGNKMTFEIRGKSDGIYSSGFASGKSKIIFNANSFTNQKDQITIESLNQAGQAVTFKADESAVNKVINISLISFDNQRRYELEGLSILAGQSITLQHNDACRELIIHNTQQTINFNLKLFINNNESTVLSKDNIIIDPTNVLHFEPTNWADIENNVVNSFIKVDSFDVLGGTLLSSKMI